MSGSKSADMNVTLTLVGGDIGSEVECIVDGNVSQAIILSDSNVQCLIPSSGIASNRVVYLRLGSTHDIGPVSFESYDCNIWDCDTCTGRADCQWCAYTETCNGIGICDDAYISNTCPNLYSVSPQFASIADTGNTDITFYASGLIDVQYSCIFDNGTIYSVIETSRITIFMY